MSTVYLGFNPATVGIRALRCPDYPSRPSVLASYGIGKCKAWLANRSSVDVAKWCVDSGAFSVFNAGRTIDLQEYIDFCQMVMALGNPPAEIFSLDVIGGPGAGLSYQKSARLTMANTEAMWKAGVPAIPTFHMGEDEAVLQAMANSFPKIALGGSVRGGLIDMSGRIRWVQQCFARVWPKPVHGMGLAAREYLEAVPFHSVDSSLWYLRVVKFGAYKSFHDAPMKLFGDKVDLRPQVAYFLRLEKLARDRWRSELAQLEEKLHGNVHRHQNHGDRRGASTRPAIRKQV